MSPRHWRFKVVEWLDGWFHVHICNLYERLLDGEVDAGRHEPIENYGTVEDGYGSTWNKCGPGCSLEVVRPGEAQCVTLQDALTGYDPRPATCPDRSEAI